MYPSIERLREFLAVPGENRPMMLSEFCHAMGNSLGGMDAYMREIWNTPRLMGGCIWEWADHALRAPSGQLLYGGDFGEIKHNGNLCADGLVSPDRVPHSNLLELKAAYAPIALHYADGVVTMENRYVFTSTQQLDLRATLLLNGEQQWQKVLACPVIGPQASGTLPLEADALPGGETVLLLEAVWRTPMMGMQAGESVCAHHHVWEAKRFAPAPSAHPLGCTYRQGMLQRAAGAILGVKPTLWRAPLDNDRLIRQTWETPAGENIQKVVLNLRECHQDGQTLRVSYALGGMSYRPALCGSIGWMEKDNVLCITHSAAVREDYPSWLPRAGLQWTVDKRFHHVRYYGLGPHENYEDKHLSVHPGFWEYDALQRRETYVRPQECGSVWRAQLVTLTDDEGRGILLYGPEPFPFNVQPWTPEELAAAAHPEDLPECTALTLHTDLRMSGIGSASVGPALPGEYGIQPGSTYSQTLYLTAFDSAQDDLFAFWKE